MVALTLGVWFSQRGAFQHLSDAVFGPRVDWHSDYAMSLRLYDLIASRHLTDVPKRCLLLNIHGGDPADAQLLDVFERPTASCMGTGAAAVRVLPRLFTMRVDRESGLVETDAGTPGRFHPLPAR